MRAVIAHSAAQLRTLFIERWRAAAYFEPARETSAPIAIERSNLWTVVSRLGGQPSIPGLSVRQDNTCDHVCDGFGEMLLTTPSTHRPRHKNCQSAQPALQSDTCRFPPTNWSELVGGGCRWSGDRIGID